jgi:hypothetical protein
VCFYGDSFIDNIKMTYNLELRGYLEYK